MTFSALSRPLLASTAMVLVISPLAAGQEQETEPAGDEVRELQTVIVRGEFIPEPQRQTSQVASFLSNEDLLRQGDANAALALTRLSGLSVVDEKFAYVRGLGDRYSVALLNGSPLPSPEPLRRTVPLNLFPSNVLDGAAVQKTYSANYPGEFGGGIIDLKTVKMPRENFLDIKVGTGYNSVTTASSGLYVFGDDLDWTGYDDGLRDIPGPISAAISSGTRLRDLSPAELEAAGESLVNTPLNVIQRGELGPTVSGSVDGGLVLDRGDVEIGLIGVAGYDQDWTIQEATRQFQRGNVLGDDIVSTETALDVTWNGLGSGTLIWGGQEIQATGFYVHTTTKEAQIDEGDVFDRSEAIFTESSGWFERELVFGQLNGLHEFGDISLNWQGSLSQSTRDAPYERTLRRLVNENGQPAYLQENSNSIRFSEVTDDVTGLAGGGAYAFNLGRREFEASAGADYSKTERRYDFLQLRFSDGNALAPDVEIARPDFLFGPDNIGSGGSASSFVLEEVVEDTDSYEGELEITSGFVQLEGDLLDYVEATAGVRYEEATQSVFTFDRFGNIGVEQELANDYVLPAVTVNWNFAEDLQFRLGYSQTITRPQFRELAPARFFDPDTERTYRGNSGLVDSELTNYDARLEYYLGRNQFVTLAGFFKEIDNPIEEVQFETSTFVFETTFINSPKAELFGGEIEYRTRFGVPLPGEFFADREGIFSINYTYTNSEVQASEGDQIVNPFSQQLQDATLFGLDGEQLQGTPENILNLQLGWESDAEQLTLLVNWVDDRILQRGFGSGNAELPDIIEEPGVQLDLVYNREIAVGDRAVSLGLSARNLLDEQHAEFQQSSGDLGRTEFNTYDRGVSVSASVTAKF